MIYKEEVKDLFSVDKSYYLMHCISSDFALGKGIAVGFNKRYDMKSKLKAMYPRYDKYYRDNKLNGTAIRVDKVINLITKPRYYDKPTLESMKNALSEAANICRKKHVKKLALPTIGCGLDKLRWKDVKELIKKTFNNMDIEILVCKQY